ncbi:MAG: FHA domain-containing protein [Thermoguttaceae bacterium]
MAERFLMAIVVQEVVSVSEMECALVPLNRGSPALILAGFPVKIGRGPDADVQLDDVYVSRMHCEIAVAGATLVVLDLGSTNGTFVNGVRTELSPLRSDDVLTVGRIEFVVRLQSAITKSPALR